MISSEMAELIGMSDRIMVMYRGRVVGIVPGNAPRALLGLMMAGVSADEEEVA